MQQHIVPTSPKSTERPQTSRSIQNTLFSILLALLFGVAGGVVGSIYTQNIIHRIEDVGSSSFFNFSQKTVTAKSMETVNDSLAAVYRTDNATFRAEQFVDYALAISADGWFVASDEFVQATDTFIIRSQEGVDIPVQRVVHRADLGVVYFRVDRVDLQPIDIANEKVRFGQEVITYASVFGRRVFIPEVMNVVQPSILSITSLDVVRRLRIYGPVVSAPLFNERHECLGLRRSNGEVVPAGLLVAGFVRIDKASMPNLSIPYIPVSAISYDVRVEKKYPDHGFVVTQDAGDFLVGDLIYSIDGVKIMDEDDLASRILSYVPGAQMTVEIIRATQSQEVQLIAW